jgi:hypothetical protein
MLFVGNLRRKKIGKGKNHFEEYVILSTGQYWLLQVRLNSLASNATLSKDSKRKC